MAKTEVALRAYRGADDLRRMQAVVSSRFGEAVDHVGDLAWAVRDNGHMELQSRVVLAESADGVDLLGWSWFHLSGWIDFVVSAQGGEALAQMLVAAALDTAAHCTAAGDPLERLSALCTEDDRPLLAALQAQGFTDLEHSLEITRRGLDDLAPLPEPPPGLRLGGTEDEELVHPRVECHRAAFAPSGLTLGGFRRVRRTWPYRPELDRVVLREDGRVVASALAWLDPDAGCGLLEPVGTHPEHQRQGLGSLVCLDALHALRRAGAESAQVACVSGSAGCATYHGLGFRTAKRMHMLRRPAAPTPAG